MFFAHFFAHCFIYLTIVGSRFVDIFGPTLFNVFAHCFVIYSAPHCFMFLHIVSLCIRQLEAICSAPHLLLVSYPNHYYSKETSRGNCNRTETKSIK